MGRRSQGEDSIYRRKKGGLWAARYLVDTPEGKTKRKYVYGKMRKDVAEKLAEALKGRGRGCCSMPGASPLPSFWRIVWIRRRNPCGSPRRPDENRC